MSNFNVIPNMSKPDIHIVHPPSAYIHKSRSFAQKRITCCCKGGITVDRLMIVLVILTVLATIVTVAFTIVFASNADSLQRYAVAARGVGGEYGSSGSPTGEAFGMFELKWVERELAYQFNYYNVSTITAVHVRGPVHPGTRVGPFKFSLCGSPSTTVCDVTTTPGLLKGVLDEISPSGTGVKPEITAIRKEPVFYYLEFLTNDYPATPGAMRASLGHLSGTP